MARKLTPPKTPKLAAVHWLDAAGHSTNEHLEPIEAITFGFIVEVTNTDAGEPFVRVASEIFPDGAYRDITAIPLGMVRAVHYKSIKLPKSFDGWAPKK